MANKVTFNFCKTSLPETLEEGGLYFVEPEKKIYRVVDGVATDYTGMTEVEEKVISAALNELHYKHEDLQKEVTEDEELHEEESYVASKAINDLNNRIISTEENLEQAKEDIENNSIFGWADDGGVFIKSYGGNAGYKSTSIGVGSYAAATYSTAEGYNTLASGLASHVEGYNSSVQGEASHTEGKNTKTYNDFEHAGGYYNSSTKTSSTFGNAGNTSFSHGIGTSSSRKNAIEIMQNGDIYVYGLGDYTGVYSTSAKRLQDLVGTVDLTEVNKKIDTNTTNIATNTINISTNTTNIATNKTNIATNTANIATLQSDLEEAELVTATGLADLNDRLSWHVI